MTEKTHTYQHNPSPTKAKPLAHQQDIAEHARELSAEIVSAPDFYEWLDCASSIETWTRTKGGEVLGKKIELLLAGNGPTHVLELDTRYTRGTLFNSWGYDPNTGEEQTRWDISEEATARVMEALDA